MSHFKTSGVNSANRLPAVMHKKLPACQCTSGRIFRNSQRSSSGIHRDARIASGIIDTSSSSARVGRRGEACTENVQVVRLGIKREELSALIVRREGSCSVRYVQKFDNSTELSRDGYNLPDDFGIMAVAEHVRTMEILGVWMNHQRAVFDSAAPAQVIPIALENYVNRLLPKRLGREVDRPSSPAIHNCEQPVGQVGMERLSLAANPENVV